MQNSYSAWFCTARRCKETVSNQTSNRHLRKVKVFSLLHTDLMFLREVWTLTRCNWFTEMLPASGWLLLNEPAPDQLAAPQEERRPPAKRAADSACVPAWSLCRASSSPKGEFGRAATNKVTPSQPGASVKPSSHGTCCSGSCFHIWLQCQIFSYIQSECNGIIRYILSCTGHTVQRKRPIEAWL